MSEYIPSTALVRNSYIAVHESGDEFFRWYAQIVHTTREAILRRLAGAVDLSDSYRSLESETERLNAEAACEIWLQKCADELVEDK